MATYYRPVSSATGTGVTVDDTGYARIATMERVKGSREYIAYPYAQAIRQDNGLWAVEMYVTETAQFVPMGTLQLNQFDAARLAHGIKAHQLDVIGETQPVGISQNIIDSDSLANGNAVLSRADKKRERDRERAAERAAKIALIAAERAEAAAKHNESLLTDNPELQAMLAEQLNADILNADITAQAD